MRCAVTGVRQEEEEVRRSVCDMVLFFGRDIANHYLLLAFINLASMEEIISHSSNS